MAKKKFGGSKVGKKSSSAPPPFAKKTPGFPQRGGSRKGSKMSSGMKGLGGPPC